MIEAAVHALLMGVGFLLGTVFASVAWARHCRRLEAQWRALLESQTTDRAAISRRMATFSAEPWSLDRVTRSDPPPPAS